MLNASRVRHLHDADEGVVLRDITDGAETSTATETGVSLKELDQAYWHNGEIPFGVLMVQVQITACVADDAANAAETYALSLVCDDTQAMSDSPVVLVTVPVPDGYTGMVYMFVDTRTIPDFDPDSSGTDKWLAIRATLTGDVASITYGASIVKSLNV